MKNTNPISLEIGKLPPQAVELEEAVLGGIMLESDAFIEICDILKPESFYKEQHQVIYKAVKKLFSKNSPIDMLTVIEQLTADKELEIIGGPVYITELTSRVASASHIEYHARIVQQKYLQRELIRISTDVQNKAFDESIDVNDLIDFNENELFNIQQGNISKEPISIGDIGKDELVLLEEKSKLEQDFSGIPTGLTSLDRLLNGLNKNKLIIIAARPAMGKTTLITSIAKNQAVDFNLNVAIFSLEMGRDELWYKMISDETEITTAKIISGNLTPDEWSAVEIAQGKLESANLYIDDTPGISLMEIRAKSRRLMMKKGLDVIYIDYLQLMQGNREKNGNREQEISSISRGLKIMAKELEVPVVCLSQLNRTVESRADKKPQLSDLRESGAIEQDADIVCFIHRPEYYGFTKYESGESTINKVDIITAKHRGGKIGDSSLDRTPNFSKIYDPENIVPIDDISPIEDNTDIEPDNAF